VETALRCSPEALEAERQSVAVRLVLDAFGQMDLAAVKQSERLQHWAACVRVRSAARSAGTGGRG